MAGSADVQTRQPAFCGPRSDIKERIVLEKPFFTVAEFSQAQPAELPKVLVVAPMSGHRSMMLRDLVIDLTSQFRVFIVDWADARDVPVTYGEFGYDQNIGSIIETANSVGPHISIVALCQAVVPSLAATSLLCQRGLEEAVSAIVLMGGPVDPLANPTRVVRLLRQHSLDWFKQNTIFEVSNLYEGSGRAVYPANLQLIALNAYLSRHLSERGELYDKVMNDDGLDPMRYPFLRLFTSVMDLPAQQFLENIQRVFHERRICEGRLKWKSESIDPCAIRHTALMTIEGAEDDIAAPGQTRAAHDLCRSVPESIRCHLQVPSCGHFSLFYGSIWRDQILPQVASFCRRHERRRNVTHPEKSPTEA